MVIPAGTSVMGETQKACGKLKAKPVITRIVKLMARLRC
jgi:hypothetical protein